MKDKLKLARHIERLLLEMDVLIESHVLGEEGKWASKASRILLLMMLVSQREAVHFCMRTRPDDPFDTDDLRPGYTECVITPNTGEWTGEQIFFESRMPELAICGAILKRAGIDMTKDVAEFDEALEKNARKR